MEVYSKYKKPIVIFLVVAVCGLFAFIKDARGANMDWELRGILNGKPWLLKSAVLKKRFDKTYNNFPSLILELSDLVPSEQEVCKDNPLDTNKIIVEIPIVTKGGFVNVLPDYENAIIHLKPETQGLACYHELKLNTEELNSSGKAFVSGQLQVQSSKTKTELMGSFKARVCN